MNLAHLTYAEIHKLAQKAATLSETAFRQLDRPDLQKLEKAAAELLAVLPLPPEQDRGDL